MSLWIRVQTAALDDSAVKALYQFTFRPAEVDGTPSAVQITYRYAFTIETEVVEREVNQQEKEMRVGRLKGECFDVAVATLSLALRFGCLI